jgi:hypothetical protein
MKDTEIMFFVRHLLFFFNLLVPVLLCSHISTTGVRPCPMAIEISKFRSFFGLITHFRRVNVFVLRRNKFEVARPSYYFEVTNPNSNQGTTRFFFTSQNKTTNTT